MAAIKRARKRYIDTAAPPARLQLPLSFGLPAAFAAATVLSVAFIVISHSLLDTLAYDFDEAWLILDARFILRGLRPFVDFIHHEPPLYLYLLALWGKLFGQTLVAYRMFSVVSLGVSGFLLFCLTRPFVGSAAALVSQAVFLSSPSLERALPAVPETAMVLFTLIGIVFLFLGSSRWSAYASGIAFVIALLIKSTGLAAVLAAALSLVYARAWRRLADFTAAGVVGAIAGIAWAIYLSDGIFAEILRFQLDRLGTRKVGMWSIDSGFLDISRRTGVDTPLELALASFQDYCQFPETFVPVLLFLLALISVPIWIARCARSRPTLQAFVVLWPASYLVLNFFLLDFVSGRYFVPFLAFSSFLLAAPVSLVTRNLPPLASAAVAMVVCAVLLSQLAPTIRKHQQPWYYNRAQWITDTYPTVASFTPILFAATGAEPGCGLANPANTYGSFGEALLVTESIKRFRFSDEQLVECLRTNRETLFVVDWAFYFFTRPGSSLREYLAGEGQAQRLFFSPDAMEQWNAPDLLTMSPFR